MMSDKIFSLTDDDLLKVEQIIVDRDKEGRLIS